MPTCVMRSAMSGKSASLICRAKTTWCRRCASPIGSQTFESKEVAAIVRASQRNFSSSPPRSVVPTPDADTTMIAASRIPTPTASGVPTDSSGRARASRRAAYASPKPTSSVARTTHSIS